MKQTSIILLFILIQVSASAQGNIRKSWGKYYIGDERIKKKELKRFLINTNDTEIIDNVIASNGSGVAGGIMLGIGVVFISIDKWNDITTGNSSNEVAVGSLTLIILGVGMIINSERKLKTAAKRYNEIIIAPTSNGVGFVYRF